MERKTKSGHDRFGANDRQAMICERWMTMEVHTVKPFDSVAYARALLEQYRINQAPVVKNGVLVGIVTDRDLRDAVNTVTVSAQLAGDIEAPQLPNEIPVEVVMSRNVIALPPHATLVNAAMVMRRERIGSVPIADGAHLVGILTRSDILDAFVARENGVPGQTERGAGATKHKKETSR